MAQQVVEEIFGDSIHREVVGRSAKLLRFLSSMEDALTTDHLDLIWSSCVGKAEPELQVGGRGGVCEGRGGVCEGRGGERRSSLPMSVLALCTLCLHAETEKQQAATHLVLYRYVKS